MDPRWDIFQAAQAGGAVSVPPSCSLSPSCCGWGPLAQDPLCGGCVPPAHPVRLGGAGTAGTEPAGRWPRDFSNTALLCQRPVLQRARRAPGIAVQRPGRPAAAVSTGAPCHHGEGAASTRPPRGAARFCSGAVRPSWGWGVLGRSQESLPSVLTFSSSDSFQVGKIAPLSFPSGIFPTTP